MNKKCFSILLGFFLFSSINSQTVVFNDKLLTQLTKNQTVRLASNQSFFNSYEKQKKLYDDANNKLTQIVAIQQYVYDNLVNINSGIKQGKKIYYLYHYLNEISTNAGVVLDLTFQYPEYSVLLTRFYVAATKTAIEMQKEFETEIMREDKDFLMDPFDRDAVINNMLSKARLINGYFVAIIIRLKQAKKIPYIYQILVIQTYVNLDRRIVRDIIQRYKTIF